MLFLVGYMSGYDRGITHLSHLFSSAANPWGATNIYKWFIINIFPELP
jgi:hypothetical protein